MNIQQNVSLRAYSTMRLGGIAAYATTVYNRDEMVEAINWSEQNEVPFIIIGKGSNVVWRDDGFRGLLIINKIARFEEQQEDTENYYITVGAGEEWDSVVARSVDGGMTGIEALSLIPGTAGATPVQNVGAYGQEISSVLVSVEVYDTQAKRFFNIPAIECGLGYRTSRFKTTDRGRFAITAITLHLMHGNPAAPFYKTVTDYFIAHNITSPTPQLLRQAVIDIRRSKLPDVDKVANNGSFFANPVVSEEQLLRLRDNYSGIPGWPAEEGKRTIPAAWLIEQAGLKGVHDPETGMATWDTQPLVLVNEHAQSTAQLLQFKQKIINVVSRQFGITLEQEPELLP